MEKQSQPPLPQPEQEQPDLPAQTPVIQDAPGYEAGGQIWYGVPGVKPIIIEASALRKAVALRQAEREQNP